MAHFFPFGAPTGIKLKGLSCCGRTVTTEDEACSFWLNPMEWAGDVVWDVLGLLSSSLLD